MPTVALTPHLRRFFDDLPASIEVEGTTVAEVVASLEARWPGFAHYVTDERGQLRQHVALWVDGVRVEDRERLSDPVGADARVTILQALSGG